MRFSILVALFVAACAHQKASQESVAQPAPEGDVEVPEAPEAEAASSDAEEPAPTQGDAEPVPQPELGSTKYCGKFTPPNSQTMQTADLRKKKKCAAAKASAQQEGLLDNRDETCQASLEGAQPVCVEFSGKNWSIWDATYPALRKVADCHCAP